MHQPAAPPVMLKSEILASILIHRRVIVFRSFFLAHFSVPSSDARTGPHFFRFCCYGLAISNSQATLFQKSKASNYPTLHQQRYQTMNNSSEWNQQDEILVSLLVSMGFSKIQAAQALAVCDGDVEQAANLLLSNSTHGIDGSEVSSAAVSTAGETGISTSDRHFESISGLEAPTTIVGPLSQYSLPNGQSACTCFALQAASQYLQALQKMGSNNGDNEIINSIFLKNMIEKGILIYNNLQQQDDSAVEHQVAEDILRLQVFPLRLRKPIQQGMLSNDSHHPLNFSSIFTSTKSEHQLTSCFLITKTPETVLVLLEPNHARFTIIDSHPRPQLGTEAAYAHIFPSLLSLVAYLQQIFPYMDLGPDVPELMAAAYNAFDIYDLELIVSQESSTNRRQDLRDDSECGPS